MTQNEMMYETPKLQLVGRVETLTEGNKSGTNLDATFPTHTPSNQLTFS